MKDKKFYFFGTLTAVFAIVVMVLVYKFGFDETLEKKETIVEPTEWETLEFIDNTRLTSVPMQEK